MTKAPTPTEMSKGQSDNTNNATKKKVRLNSPPPPREGPGGLSRECAPPYPQRDRKRRLNGAVCRNHRIKRLVPCRC